MGELYKLDFTNGKSYIGITTGSALGRLKSHRKAANGSRDAALYHAWRKHGEPQLVVLAVVEDKDLAETEVRAIKAFGTLAPNGYNMVDGGQPFPMKDPAIAKKSGDSRKGRKFSDEHRAKIAAAMTGNQHSKGLKRSDEFRAKMSAIRKADWERRRNG